MLSVYFGSPGCGKTTLAVYRMKHCKHPYCNFPCKIAESDDVPISTLGTYTLPAGSDLFVDESGIVWNNRNYKSFPKPTINWLKLHRHYRVDVNVFSQSWEDTDVTVRRLAERLYYVKKLGCFTLVQRVSKFVTIDDTTHQIIDGYKKGNTLIAIFRCLFRPLTFWFYRWVWRSEPSCFCIFRPRYYRYFDSYDCPPLPIYSQDS